MDDSSDVSHVPMPKFQSHTMGLLINILEILERVQKKEDVEIEITHQLLVLTFQKYKFSD